MFTPVTRLRDGRSPLLLAAALAVAVPGFLVSACSGQEGSGPAQNAARSDAVAAAGRAAGPATGNGPTGNGPTGSGPTGSGAAARRPAVARAVRLLAQAAQAAIVMSYQGEEVVTRWTGGSGSVLVSNIWHVSGGRTVTRTLDAGASLSSQPYLSADTDGQAPEGVLGVTAPLVQLLESHYLVAYAGAGSAGNRTAQVVEAWRADGSLAARYWLDDATRLPLEREVFDPAAHVTGRDVFIDVSVANQGPANQGPANQGPADKGPADKGPANQDSASQGSVPASARQAASPQSSWTGPLSSAQLLALRARGWLVPAELPGGLSLFTGAETEASAGTALDLAYSDGLSVISVFEQRGNLAARLAGWRRITVDGHMVFAAEPDQRSLTWSSRGMVYTVMADAPVLTVDAAVGALPHDRPPGFWKRMTRGLVRLASWVNPFH